MRLMHRKAQSTLEYAVLVVVIIAALLAIQIYMKRGVQGKLRESSDQVGEQFDAEKTSINITRGRTGTTTQRVQGGVTSTTSNETRTESGTEVVNNW